MDYILVLSLPGGCNTYLVLKTVYLGYKIHLVPFSVVTVPSLCHTWVHLLLLLLSQGDLSLESVKTDTIRKPILVLLRRQSGGQGPNNTDRNHGCSLRLAEVKGHPKAEQGRLDETAKGTGSGGGVGSAPTPAHLQVTAVLGSLRQWGSRLNQNSTLCSLREV